MHNGYGKENNKTEKYVEENVYERQVRMVITPLHDYTMSLS